MQPGHVDTIAARDPRATATDRVRRSPCLARRLRWIRPAPPSAKTRPSQIEQPVAPVSRRQPRWNRAPQPEQRLTCGAASRSSWHTGHFEARDRWSARTSMSSRGDGAGEGSGPFSFTPEPPTLPRSSGRRSGRRRISPSTARLRARYRGLARPPRRAAIQLCCHTRADWPPRSRGPGPAA